MKTHDLKANSTGTLESALLLLMHTSLNDDGHVHRVKNRAECAPLRTGFHRHETWELFCPVRGRFCLELCGEPYRVFETGSLVIVTPGCLHMAVDLLPQPQDLELLTVHFPMHPDGTATAGVSGAVPRESSALSHTDMTRWHNLLGMSPADMMQCAVKALDGGRWDRERGLSFLRTLFAAYAQVTRSAANRSHHRASQYAAAVLALLETRYYDADLTVERVADIVGLSPSHLGAVFRRKTGETIHRKLVSIRLRHARELLSRTKRPVKEIAALTGWSNQLYFSAAFRCAFGVSPSAFRKKHNSRDLSAES